MQKQWQIRGLDIELTTAKPWIMGVLNVTPDSFSDGGCYRELNSAAKQALLMQKQGAQIIDIGGESTKPGAQIISEQEELARVIPVIKAIRKCSKVYLSIDTTKSSVARAAIEAGADIINDISGLEQDSHMLQVALDNPQVAIVVMHRQGLSKYMQDAPTYNHVVADVASYLQARYLALTKAGIAANRLCFDPGIGFGKTLQHNLALIKHLEKLRVNNCPLLLGLSRKSMFGHCLSHGATEPDNEMKLNLREAPTAALTGYTAQNGADIIRVHDVQLNQKVLRGMSLIQPS